MSFTNSDERFSANLHELSAKCTAVKGVAVKGVAAKPAKVAIFF